jgi:hypothetical protein
MAENKYASERENMTRQPVRLVQGNIPALDPDSRQNPGQNWQKLDPRMEGTVKRLIAHLKDEK